MKAHASYAGGSTTLVTYAVSFGGYAGTLHCTQECADILAHVWVDGEQTEEMDEYVRVVGPWEL